MVLKNSFMLSWGSYWTDNPKLFMKVMEKSTQFFAQKLIKSKLITGNTRLLDFGCGPGYLATQLKDRIALYYGVDISEIYIKTAREKCADIADFYFLQLPEDHSPDGLNTLGLPKAGFDTVIILSVIQYLKNKEEVLALLQNCKSFIHSSGKIILADVIENDNGLWKDALNVLKHSISNFYVGSFIRFMFRIKFSKYNSLRKVHKLLYLSEAEVNNLCQELHMQYVILPHLTIHSNRVSYCLTL
jgi:2-polyprenyl-3-methyl-5-hydroxy-6-metoxy-1,4-benzoquinol methylase